MINETGEGHFQLEYQINDDNSCVTASGSQLHKMVVSAERLNSFLVNYQSMRDTNLGDEPEPVTELLEEYNIISKFETEVGRVNVQALGMKIHPREHGQGSYEYDLLDRMDGQAAVYYPPEIDFSAVLFFQTGWGYYCCQSPQDVEPVKSWFQTQLAEEAKREDSLMNLPDIDGE